MRLRLLIFVGLSVLLPYSVLASSFGPSLLVNTENFTIIDDAGGTSDVELRFGDTVNERLLWNTVASRFEFTDDVHVLNNLSGSGTLRIEGNVATKADLFINADNGASDAVLTFGNDALPESLIFKRTLSQFEFSDDVYIANSLSASGSVFFEGNMIVDAGAITVDAAANKVGIGNTTPHSTLTLSGSLSVPVLVKTGNYTLGDSDHTIYASGSVVLTLPTAVGIRGRSYTIKRVTHGSGATNVTLNPSAGQLIDGRTSYTLGIYGETVTVQSDNVGWQTINTQPFDWSSITRVGTAANRWYSYGNGTYNFTATTAATAVGTLRAYPILITKPTQIDQLAINVTAAAAVGSLARVGIYRDNGNVYPGSLVVDAGTAATNTTGVKTFATNLPVRLEPGLYWLAQNYGTGAPTLRGVGSILMPQPLGYDATLGTNAPGIGWTVAFAFAAMPANFPSTATVIPNPATTGGVPGVFYRISNNY